MLELTMTLRQIDSTIWELTKKYQPGMKVPARIIATPKLLNSIEDRVFKQLANTASLPGLVDCVWALPDTHVGFGVPIGSVFATNPNKKGIISPGAVGFDINCGIRLITTSLTEKEIKPKLVKIIDQLFPVVGAGLGAKAKEKLTQKEIEAVCEKGVEWAIGQGKGKKEDGEFCEERGSMKGARLEFVSPRAFERGKQQLGTLGSGNHFLEIQKVVDIFDKEKAKKLGITNKNQITIMIHCGSRGFGHQIASDYIKEFKTLMNKYNISPPDDQLACVPFNSSDGQRYWGAMIAAANYAFTNRQILTNKLRQILTEVFKTKTENLGLDLVYDVAHNIAKLENGLLIHRKGATRALGPDNQNLPEKYRTIGQPVIIGGSMETASYLLLGTKKAEELTFASTCHGAGRIMSRTQARKQVRGEKLQQDLKQKGIYIRPASFRGLAEEAGKAYKDIDAVIEAVAKAGISLPLVKLEPLGNIKG